MADTIQIQQVYSPTSRWSIHHERSEFALYDDNGHRRYAISIHCDVVHTNGNVPFKDIGYDVTENMLCPSSTALVEQNGACLSFLYLRGTGATAHFHRNPETRLIHMEHVMDEASTGTMECNEENTAVNLKNSDCGLVIALYRGGSLQVFEERFGHMTYSFDGRSLWMNGTVGVGNE